MEINAPPYYLQTLGTHRLTRGGVTCDVGSYGLAIVAYVGLSRRVPDRSELCELLWGVDGPDERHRLRQLLYSVRRKLPGLLTNRGHELAEAMISVDAATCAAALKEGRVERAIGIYAGDFFQNFPPISPQFTDWRDSTAAQLQNNLRRSVRARLKARDLTPADIILLTGWLREYDALDVDDRVKMIGALADLTRSQEAEVELQHLEGVQLSRDQQFVIETLTKRLQSNIPSIENVPVVLAEATRRDVAARITKAHHPMTLLIGEGGMGKTRLLDWIARLAAIRGARVFTPSITSVVPRHPASNIRRIMSALNVPQEAIEKVPPDELASMAGATADCLGQQWTLVAVDNFNHADNATREFCRLLPAMSKSQAIMVVCAMTGDLNADDASWMNAFSPNIDVIRVSPLDDHLSAVLLDRIAAAYGYALTEGQRSVIIENGNGIPRRIIRMAEVIADSGDTPSMWELDIRSTQRATSQIAALCKRLQEVLGCLVLSPSTRDPLAIGSAVGISETEVIEALQKLSEKSLVRMSSHETMAVEAHVQKAYLAVTPPTIQNELHRRLAAFYSSNEEYLLAADHYDKGGDWHSAGAQHELAAQSAMCAGLFEGVERACKAALKRSATSDEYQSRSRLLASYYCRVSRWEDAYPHLLSLANRTPEEELALLTSSVAFIEGSSGEEWQEIVDRLTEMRKTGVDQAAIARAYLVAFDRAYQYGQEAIILPAFRRFLEDRTVSNPRGLAEVLMKSARINQLFGDPKVALAEAAEAVNCAQIANDPVVLSNAFNTRALVSFLRGEPDSAFTDFEESERIAASAALYFLRERYYNNLAVLNYEIGEFAEARRLLRTAALFSPHVQLYALANLAVLELSVCNFELARSYGFRLRSAPSITHSIIGLTVCGIADLASGDVPSAQQAFWDLHNRTNSFQLQLTDPSYTLSFAAECAPAVGMDIVPHITMAASRIAPRNVYSFLRLRLALARVMMVRSPTEARDICRGSLALAKAAKAATTYAQAEALLATS